LEPAQIESKILHSEQELDHAPQDEWERQILHHLPPSSRFDGIEERLHPLLNRRTHVMTHLPQDRIHDPLKPGMDSTIVDQELSAEEPRDGRLPVSQR